MSAGEWAVATARYLRGTISLDGGVIDGGSTDGGRAESAPGDGHVNLYLLNNRPEPELRHDFEECGRRLARGFWSYEGLVDIHYLNDLPLQEPPEEEPVSEATSINCEQLLRGADLMVTSNRPRFSGEDILRISL